MKPWITSQIGAREHYAIPRVLHREGKLDSLYTDFWASTPLRMLGKLTGKSSLATRFHPELATAPVTGFNLQALKFSRRRYANPYDGFLQVGEAFGRSVVADLQSRDERRGTRAKFNTSDSTALDATSLPITNHPSPIPHVFFSYDTGFLEPARWVKERGGKTIVCQMDPARYEVDLVREEEARWPGWSRRWAEVPEAYFWRREQEWAIADLVMVNSEWSKQALIRQGVPEHKLVVVPLAFEARNSRLSTLVTRPAAGTSSRLSTFDSRRKLRVLFLGQVILRKGIQYLIEAAKLLKDESIHFDVVGPIGISEEALESAPSNITFHGSVTRDRTQEFYERADIFVLPTLSDGFALTQLEAMAYGLPVIATPNCGEVVTDGVDGLIVPASDSSALAEAFQLLIQDPEKLRSMSDATKAKVEQFSLARLGEKLSALEQRL
jgi:glycosyltransferase involved in cell wall biosynthesis